MLRAPKFLSPAQTALLTSVANCLAMSTWTCSRCPVSSSSQGDLLTQQMATYSGVLSRSLGPGPRTHRAVLAESFLPSGLSFLICEVRRETGLGMANGFHLEDRPRHAVMACFRATRALCQRVRYQCPGLLCVCVGGGDWKLKTGAWISHLCPCLLCPRTRPALKIHDCPVTSKKSLSQGFASS